MIRKIASGLTLLVILGAVVAPAWADRDRPDGDRNHRNTQRPQGPVITHDRRSYTHERREYTERERKDFEQRGFHYDSRFSHNRYYPPRGYVVPSLPRHYHRIPYRGVDYYFSAGVWYIGTNVGFRVVIPPVGLVVTALPPFYTTIWVSGVPYYYADGIYYVWRPTVPGYVVVEAPNEAKINSEAAVPEELYIYPKEGQSEEKQATDRYECYRWSADQTGFDPTQPGGGVPADQHATKHADYQRAMKACLEGRGYSVK